MNPAREAYKDFARRRDYYPGKVSQPEAEEFIQRHHYAKGMSNTAVLRMGLFDPRGVLVAVAVWSVPGSPNVARWASRQFEKAQPGEVLALSRMAARPGQPKGLVSMVLAASFKEIRRMGGYRGAVTYADSREGHVGRIYATTGWTRRGSGQSRAKWVDAEGRQVAKKSTRNRTSKEMAARGFKKLPPASKARYIKAIRDRILPEKEASRE